MQMIRDTTGNEKRYLIKIRLMAAFAKVWKFPPKYHYFKCLIFGTKNKIALEKCALQFFYLDQFNEVNF